MRILIAGKSGQLAQAFASIRRHSVEIIAAGRPELDISDAAQTAAFVTRVAPDIVINAAAYTAVDKAEDEPDAAFLLNETGAANLARAASAIGAPIIHFSTDYVFDGTATRPYRETDPTNPLGVYGASKLAGEQAVANANPDYIVLRTAWVFSEFGANFLKTILRLATDRPSLRVVADQAGTPTYAVDLARAALDICAAIQQRKITDWRGVYHLVPEGQTNWAEFAAEIFRQSQAIGGPYAEVKHITTADYPTRAKRPAFSVLDPSLAAARFGVHLPDWRNATSRCVTALGQAQETK